MARPARVRIRVRKPCTRARRRLFGWNVRFPFATVKLLWCWSAAVRAPPASVLAGGFPPGVRSPGMMIFIEIRQPVSMPEHGGRTQYPHRRAVGTWWVRLRPGVRRRHCPHTHRSTDLVARDHRAWSDHVTDHHRLRDPGGPVQIDMPGNHDSFGGCPRNDIDEIFPPPPGIPGPRWGRSPSARHSRVAAQAGESQQSGRRLDTGGSHQVTIEQSPTTHRVWKPRPVDNQGGGSGKFSTSPDRRRSERHKVQLKFSTACPLSCGQLFTTQLSTTVDKTVEYEVAAGIFTDTGCE